MTRRSEGLKSAASALICRYSGKPRKTSLLDPNSSATRVCGISRGSGTYTFETMVGRALRDWIPRSDVSTLKGMPLIGMLPAFVAAVTEDERTNQIWSAFEYHSILTISSSGEGEADSVSVGSSVKECFERVIVARL